MGKVRSFPFLASPDTMWCNIINIAKLHDDLWISECNARRSLMPYLCSIYVSICNWHKMSWSWFDADSDPFLNYSYYHHSNHENNYWLHLYLWVGQQQFVHITKQVKGERKQVLNANIFESLLSEISHGLIQTNSTTYIHAIYKTLSLFYVIDSNIPRCTFLVFLPFLILIPIPMEIGGLKNIWIELWGLRTTIKPLI